MREDEREEEEEPAYDLSFFFAEAEGAADIFLDFFSADSNDLAGAAGEGDGEAEDLGLALRARTGAAEAPGGGAREDETGELTTARS